MNYNDEIVRCEHTPDMFDVVIESNEFKDKYNLTISIIIEEWYRAERMLNALENDDDRYEFKKGCEIGKAVCCHGLIEEISSSEQADDIQGIIDYGIKLDIKQWKFIEWFEAGLNETI